MFYILLHGTTEGNVIHSKVSNCQITERAECYRCETTSAIIHALGNCSSQRWHHAICCTGGASVWTRRTSAQNAEKDQRVKGVFVMSQLLIRILLQIWTIIKRLHNNLWGLMLIWTRVNSSTAFRPAGLEDRALGRMFWRFSACPVSFYTCCAFMPVMSLHFSRNTHHLSITEGAASHHCADTCPDAHEYTHGQHDRLSICVYCKIKKHQILY